MAKSLIFVYNFSFSLLKELNFYFLSYTVLYIPYSCLCDYTNSQKNVETFLKTSFVNYVKKVDINCPYFPLTQNFMFHFLRFCFYIFFCKIYKLFMNS